MFATVAEGHIDAADLLFLVAVVLFVVVTVVHVAAKAWPAALTTAGLAFVAVAWLVL